VRKSTTGSRNREAAIGSNSTRPAATGACHINGGPSFRGRLGSGAAELSEDDGDGFEDDDQVEPEGSFFDVLDVVADPFLEVCAALAGALDLPEARDARADAEAGLAPGRAVLVFAVGAGAGE